MSTTDVHDFFAGLAGDFSHRRAGRRERPQAHDC